MRNKIALFTPYFGEHPAYFPYFINSIKGKDFDLYVVSDTDYLGELPNNCMWLKFTFNQFVELVATKLNAQVNIQSAYKICDYRPMYGIIFQDYLETYSFWGNIDIDVIVGNFNKFISDDLLDSIEFYSGVKEYVSGPFSLIRNNQQMNSLWQQSKDIQKIITSSDYFGFDEVGGRHWDELKSGKSILDIKTDIQSFTELIKLEEQNGLRTCFVDTTIEPKGFEPIHCKMGEIKYLDKEYMMLHLLYFKTRFYFSVPKVKSIYTFINSFGFMDYNPKSIHFFLSKHPRMWIVKKIKIQYNKLFSLE